MIANNLIYLILFIGAILCLLSRYWFVLSRSLKIYSLSRPHKKKSYNISITLYIKHLILLSIGLFMILTSLATFISYYSTDLARVFLIIGDVYVIWLIYKSSTYSKNKII